MTNPRSSMQPWWVTQRKALLTALAIVAILVIGVLTLGRGKKQKELRQEERGPERRVQVRRHRCRPCLSMSTRRESGLLSMQ